MESDPTDYDLFDVEDVVYEFEQSKDRCEIVLILRTETGFNLLKYYKSLKAYVHKMETEMGVLEAEARIH